MWGSKYRPCVLGGSKPYPGTFAIFCAVGLMGEVSHCEYFTVDLFLSQLVKCTTVNHRSSHYITLFGGLFILGIKTFDLLGGIWI